MSLLKKALETPKFASKRLRIDAQISEQDAIDLSLAWLKGDISYRQFSTTVERTGSAAYGLIATGLRCAYKNGLLKVKSSN